MIEPAAFARDRKQMDGWVDAAALLRLDDRLFDRLGGIAFRVEGRQTDEGHAVLSFKLRLELNLRCQRCLGAMPFAQEAQREIVFVPGYGVVEQDAADDDSIDILPLVPALDLQEVIEEEALLSLPLAPRHPDGVCVTDAASASKAGSTDSPFTALAGIGRS